VTDSAGKSATKSSAIVIAAPVQNPIANFIFNPASGTVPVNVLFDASTSTSPNGPILSYAWDFGDGNTGTGMTPSHVYAFAGTFLVNLTVTDSAGKSAVKLSQIVIVAPILPVASFTYTVGLPGTFIVSVDGSASTSANGPILLYGWNWGDGSANTSGVTSSYTYAAAGSYVVTLTISDSLGNIASTSQTIVVP
jgi:PKD repeat protein